ncbi:MAG TPA: hypothetical protein VK717_07635 [Opitutaceae bacterium]|nr:hypothetical protein [Opitutaceae bacterium]
MRPHADGITHGKADRDFSLFTSLLPEAQQIRIEPFQAGGDPVQALDHFAFQTDPVQRQSRAKITFFDCAKGSNQLLHEIAIVPGAGPGMIRCGLLSFRMFLSSHR